ncbi:MAG TPA: DUF2911 domain-containing protein [Luteibaculaceae bacterium]|nr:DUF2911 domain-containing protein [Luteibaculaceae bacterium]
MRKQITLMASAFLFTATVATAQIKTPQPSPVSTIKQELGLAEVEVTYSRPSAKGRTIFGDVVPFDKMWRTGANASTKIKFNEKLTFNGVAVDKGEYALYTIPGQTEWTVVLYKDLTCWGVCDEYDATKEAARFKVTPRALSQSVETFTIAFENLSLNGGNLTLSWAKTAVDVKVEMDVDSKVMAAIDAFMNPKPDYRPFYNAASYYFDTNKDLNKALEYASKAADLRPEAYWVLHLKAKIQHGLKDYKGAIATAELSKKAAQADKNDDYVSMNDKLIAKAKAGK